VRLLAVLRARVTHAVLVNVVCAWQDDLRSSRMVRRDNILHHTGKYTATHCITRANTIHALWDSAYMPPSRCNTPQHTATHCNTLQRTATHCSILHHTETHCNTLQHTATHCITATHANTTAVSWDSAYTPPPLQLRTARGADRLGSVGECTQGSFVCVQGSFASVKSVCERVYGCLGVYKAFL